MLEHDSLLIYDLDNTLIDTSEAYWRIKDAFIEHELLDRLDKKELDQRYEAIEAEGMKVWSHAPLRLKYTMFRLYDELLREGKISRSEALEAVINEAGDELHNGPYPKLLPGAKALVAGTQKIVDAQIVVTQGDHALQQKKVDKRGLRQYFNEVVAVPRKDAHTFSAIIASRKVDPKNVCVVGDSVRSDITPALEVGAHAILYQFVSPSRFAAKYQATSAFFKAEAQGSTPYVQAPTLKDVKAAITAWAAEQAHKKSRAYMTGIVDTI